MNNKNRICFVAQFPPPMHGLSKAVETLYNSSISEEFKLEKIDITDNKKFLKTIFLILKSKADLFYFTISQTIGGNVRDLIILKLFEIKGKKVLIHLHGGYYRRLVDNDMKTWQKKANYKAISKIEGAIVLGPSLRWMFEDMLPDKKIYTVANCVDDQYLLNTESVSEKLKQIEHEEVRHVLYLSNFIKSKGYVDVLEMAKQEKERVLSGKNKRYHFHFAGKFFTNDERMFFEKFVSNNHLKEYITYHGIVSGNEKSKLLEQSHYFVLLTRYPNEGQPISILEAMGNGAVVITTNHAGIPDVVQDNITGIIVDKDEENLSKIALKRMEKSNYEQIAINARNAVLNNYTERVYVNNMKQVFESVRS